MRLFEWFRFVKSLDELRVNLDRQRRDIERYRELNDQLSEELGELRCIASEMAKALRAVRDMHRAHCLIEPEQPCATCADKWLCPGRVADKAFGKWEKWREGQS